MRTLGRGLTAIGVILSLWAISGHGIVSADDGPGDDEAGSGGTSRSDSEFVPRDPLHRLERLNGGTIGELFEEIVGSSRRSVIPLFTTEGKPVALATAFTRDGYALTKASELELHREANNGELVARVSGEGDVKVRFLGQQKENDLALLKVDVPLEPLEWVPPEEIKAGYWVAAFSHEVETVKVGIVSAAIRPIEREGGYVGVKVHAREGRGALILHVFENSGADRAGLKSGDVVHFVAEKPVNSTTDFMNIVTQFDANDTVEVVVERQVDGRTRKWAVDVKLGYRQEDDAGRNQIVNGESSRAPRWVSKRDSARYSPEPRSHGRPSLHSRWARDWDKHRPPGSSDDVCVASRPGEQDCLRDDR